MSEIPILFNTEMVRAILDGRKTQTRRVIKPHLTENEAGWRICFNGEGIAYAIETYDDDERFQGYAPPPYKPGDVLWVRETWNYGYIETSDAEGSCESWFEELRQPASGYLGALSGYFYRADESDEKIMREVGGWWRPSIHMPRRAARIFLRVKAVRIERLHDMTAQDSLDEGVKLHLKDILDGADPLLPFAELWNTTINKEDFSKYCWSANPWVWVIEFERIEPKEG